MDIVRATRLSLPTINNILAMLQARKYITPLGSAKPSSGRPPVRYRFNPSVQYVVGIEIQVPKMVIALLDLHANVTGIAQRLPEVAQPKLSIRIGNKLKIEDLVATAALPAIQAHFGFQPVGVA